jgi:hypothetical protein
MFIQISAIIPQTTPNLFDNYIIRYVLFLSIRATLIFECRLQKEYRAFNEKLGQTSTGLQYEEMQEGSPLQNLIGELCPDLPTSPC